MNRALNILKKYNLFISAVVLVFIALFVTLSSQAYRTKTEANQIIKENKYYAVKIDYPDLESKPIEQKIKDKQNGYMKEFLAVVKKNKGSISEKYDFSSTYTVQKFNNVESVRVITYSFLGENNYSKYYDSYHYDTKTGEEIELNHFLQNDDSYNKLKSKAYFYILKYLKENGISYKTDDVTEMLSQENIFDSFYFSESGMEMVFPPVTKETENTGDVHITIPYSNLNGILKPEYNLAKTVSVNAKVPVKRDISKFKDKKLLAFTFDDGPSRHTEALLRNLDKYDARVTFFVLGSRVTAYKDALIKCYESGNQIGSHTYSHANLKKLDDYTLLKEINDTNNAVKSIIGVEPKLLRPPYGSFDGHISELADMEFILWNVDTLDWKIKDKQRIKAQIVKNARDGSVILLHDLYGTSVEGALLAMEELKAKDFAFVTIDEMMELKGISADENKAYYSFIGD